MNKIFLIFFLFTILSKKISAQEINVTGKVIDKMTKDPVENAIISVYNEKKIVFNAVSDSSGTFKIPVVFYRKASSIKIHVLSYSDFELDIIPKIDTAQQKYYFLGIYKINPKSIELKEVSIKARRRYNDTTRIDLSKEKFEHSARVEDLFSSGYGFSKDANGQLYYKGKPISNVLVNGGDFFGKNNLDIYHLLPALTLDNIQVVETNIDSITNITLLRPVVKINLIFKDKYKNGKFGNINLGAGTAQRYLANTNLFSYKKEEQVSLSVNSNNVNTNDNTIQDPRVSFAANGNKVATNSATFTWRNVYANKIQADLSIDGKMGTKNFTSEADLQQVSPPLFSHTFNSSNIRSLDINNTEFNIKYRIDSLNNINITQTFDRSRTKEWDSLNYNVLLDSLNTISQLDKLRHANTDLLGTKMGYQKKFPGKKGRLLNIDFEMNNNHYTVNEFDNIADLGDQSLKKYFIDGNRSVTEHKYAVNSGFTEPINDDTYIQFFASCRWETMNYSPRINSDRVIVSSDDPSLLTNNYIQSGIKFRKTLNKVSIDATAGGIILLRSIDQPHGNNNASFFNPDLDLRVDYKIRKDKSLVFGYSDKPNYPRIQQLVALNSTFDLISQTSGNIYINPEEKRSISVTYSTKPSKSVYINVSGEFDHYNNKFGYVVGNSGGNSADDIFTSNLGKSNAARILFSFFKNLSGDWYVNYTNGITYQESPTLLNSKLVLDNSLTFNQSFSTSFMIIKPLLSVKPLFAFSYGRFLYETNIADITTITNSDQVSLKVKTLELNLYPLFNYNHNINSNSSFSMNGELKKIIFKKYGSIWIQAYDIFNSFKLYSNYAGPAGYQSIRYSNLQRYFMAGVSLQFNNMK